MDFIRTRLLTKAKSEREFYQSIMATGLSLDYDRKGRCCGVVDTNLKRYTWKKLGIEPRDFDRLKEKEQYHTLEKKISRLEQLHQLRAKNNDKDLSR